MLRVSEVFESIQGEGPYVGVPAHFVRLQGCNLVNLPCGPCRMCDTSYAIPLKTPSSLYAEGDFLRLLKSKRLPLLVITGGEPLLQQRKLVQYLSKVPPELLPKLNVETNGTIPPSRDWSKFDTLFSVSPKLHTSSYLNLKSFRGFKKILKVVYNKEVDDHTFAQFVFKCASQLGIASEEDIYVMPKSRTRDSYVEQGLSCFEFCMKYGFRLGTREHLVLFDGVAGK